MSATLVAESGVTVTRHRGGHDTMLYSRYALVVQKALEDFQKAPIKTAEYRQKEQAFDAIRNEWMAAVKKVIRPTEGNVLVYRIEMEDSTGPFQPDTDEMRIFQYESHFEKEAFSAPGWKSSGMSRIKSDEFCGCQSLALLKEWFGNYVDFLEDQGFGVAVYSVPAEHIRWGATQVAFRMDSASRISWDAEFVF